VTQYWTLLTLGTLFLFATFYVGERFKVLLINTIHAEGYHVRGSVWMILVAYAITVLISTSLFLLMYLSVPNTRVRLLPALAGAFVAAVLWEAGKWGFTQYLHFSTGYSKLYGSIALIPLFLLWVYVTWIVILAGLHVSYFLQHGRHRTTAEPTPEADPAIVDPTSPLLLMRTIAENFRVGQPCTIEALSKRTHLATPITRQIIERAIDKHLIHRVSGEPGISAAPAYVLARAPSDIAASEILGIGFDLTDLPAGSNASSTDMIRSLRQAQLNAVADKTLADLVDPSSRPLPVPGSVSPAVAGTPPNPRPDGYSNGAGVDTLLSRSDPGREK
jgi:membrane protein